MLAVVSAGTFVEASIVLEAGRPGRGAGEILCLLENLGLDTPFTEAEALQAIQGFIHFGKGRHKARLNFGDCASYGAAKVQGGAIT